ncbi:MAG TPA: propionate/acetate kinase [Candidatus Sulfotelmatobacter sp.]|nr:propionate/acetate kinase [Candidatus Sulfotelmatobacter sp.]
MNALAFNAGGGSNRAILYALPAGDVLPLEPPTPLWSGEIEENDAPLDQLFATLPDVPVALVAHRVVHGGLDPARPLQARIDASVLDAIRAAVPLAPAHNRPALDGIAYARQRFPGVPQIAVFDDALGPDAPELAQTVTGPPEWRARFGIRRIGFHGISHRDVIERVLALLGRADAKIVAVHLGSGASAIAFDGRRIVETTMGMTPLDGAMMGTRAGAVDPGVLFHLLRNGYDAARLEDDVSHRSGLAGISGLSLDTRILIDAAARGNARAAFALDLYYYRMAQCIGELFATLNGADALSFTGPIGQHMPPVRMGIVARLGFAGFALDAERNDAIAEGEPVDGPLHAAGSRPVFSIRTLEEWAMLRRAIALR